MTEQDERIFKMLRSDDPEMVILGVTTAMAMGPVWCLDNLTLTGNKIQDFPDSLSSKVFIKGHMVATFYKGYIDIKYHSRIPKGYRAPKRHRVLSGTLPTKLEIVNLN